MTGEVCEDCGRPNGTEEQLDETDFDGPVLCFTSVLFDGDEDPHCKRIRANGLAQAVAAWRLWAVRHLGFTVDRGLMTDEELRAAITKAIK
jgi:hypothetical protein